MAHGLDSTKSPARPAHEAIEGRGSGDEIPELEKDREKIDSAAMRGAKRAQNRIVDAEAKNPGGQEFTK
jgi:hypothetical protein